MNSSAKKHSNGNKYIEPDIIHAALVSDLDEAEAALAKDPECIYQKNLFSMNALQVAILEMHEDMAFYLLENSEISARHKDFLGRDALRMAIMFGSDELCEAADERWEKERYAQLKSNNIVPFNKPNP